MEAKHSSCDPVSNIIYGSNPKVTTAKICNSWNIFNFKKILKLQITPPSLILLIAYPRVDKCFPAEAEK
jgi:hypothetical protein